MKKLKGFTLVELLVVIAIIALLVGLLLPALAKARANAQSLKDKTQIQQIHKAALGFANENKAKLPTPGLIDRKPDVPAPPGLGDKQGVGPEDFILNTTANLYSAMIAQDLFKPDLCIGTTENNQYIEQKTDYNYNAYKPSVDNYWDTTFKGTPDTSASQRCNTSYSHMALCGARKKNKWNSTQEAGVPAFGTRGTGGPQAGTPAYIYGGAMTGPEYDLSPTLELRQPKKSWDGHVIFNDNHAESLNTLYSPMVNYLANNTLLHTRDNIYACEYFDYVQGIAGGSQRASNDAWLGMFSSVTAENATTSNNAEPEFDPLIQ